MQAVHYGTADGETSPWFQDNSNRLEFKWELEKKEEILGHSEMYKMNDERCTQILFHSGRDDCLPVGPDDYYD